MIRSKEMILFYPSTTTERSICDKMRIPFVNSTVLGGFVYFGDLSEKEKYLKIIEDEEKRVKELRQKLENGDITL